MSKDFVHELIHDRTRRNPRFPRLVAEVEARRAMARRLAAVQKRKSLPRR